MSSIICACAVVFVVVYNVTWISGEMGNRVRELIRPVGLQTRLAQKWIMFYIPFQVDPWCVYRARLQNGDVVDLIRGGSAPSDERPEELPSMFPNHRWNKMHHRLEIAGYETPEQLHRYRHRVAEYICRKWNRAHGKDQQVLRLEVQMFGTQIGPRAKPGQFSQAIFATLVLAEPDQISTFQEELLRIERGEDPF